jgi:hypothetical protein
MPSFLMPVVSDIFVTYVFTALGSSAALIVFSHRLAGLKL